MTDPMITATQHLEAQEKPSYGPHKPAERYLDDEDWNVSETLHVLLNTWIGYNDEVTVSELLQALETLRTHLRRKYYGG